MRQAPVGAAIDVLWTRFLADEPICAEDRAVLAAAVREDEILRRRLLADLRLHGALLAAAESEGREAAQKEAAFEARLAKALAAEESGPDASTVRAPAVLPWAKRSQSRTGALLVLAGAAAAMAIAAPFTFRDGPPPPGLPGITAAKGPPGPASPSGQTPNPVGLGPGRGRTAVLLVGTEESIDLATPMDALFPGDRRLHARLEGLGFAVIATHACDKGQARAARASLVVLSETVAAEELGPGFTGLPAPMLVLDPVAFARLGLTGGRSDRDRGTTEPQTTVRVTSPLHPLAAGLTGHVPVLVRPLPAGFGVPGPDALVIATGIAPASGREVPLVFAYERGSRMVRGTARARRAGLFLGDGQVLDALTDAGWRLFDAAASWAAGD